MGDVTVTFDGVGAMYALEALAIAAAEADRKTTALIEQGAPGEIIDIHVRVAALKERNHVALRDRLFPPGEAEAMAERELAAHEAHHLGDPDCVHCERAVDYFSQSQAYA